jgi:hypothetical protein
MRIIAPSTKYQKCGTPSTENKRRGDQPKSDRDFTAVQRLGDVPSWGGALGAWVVANKDAGNPRSELRDLVSALVDAERKAEFEEVPDVLPLQQN